MLNLKKAFAFLALIVFAFTFTGCSAELKNSGSSTSISIFGAKETLKIASGSENQELEGILKDFTQKNNINIEITYKGSLDIMSELQNESTDYDAVWPANSLWINMGDSKLHRVKDVKSTSLTPVVFGIKKSIAEKLGFVGKQVSVKDILTAIQNKQLTFCMTSATQSNSGASAYIGFLYALLGNPGIITAQDLDNQELKDQLRSILSGVNRSSGSSDWLKSLFLSSDYDAMVNYESLIISTNEQLVSQGKEPLYIVYPYDGLTIADSPLGYVNKNNSSKEDAFKKLQDYLLSPEIQDKIQHSGRRTGFSGINDNNKDVFKAEWGVDTKKILSPIKMPAPEVITKALNMYQTELKKPSINIYCLDYSGSMSGDGVSQLTSAMQQILIQENASQYLLQATKDEINIVIPFNDSIINTFNTTGNAPSDLSKLFNQMSGERPGGSTDIYSPAIKGLELLKNYDLTKYQPAIILMTDGQSNKGKGFNDFKNEYEKAKLDVPVFSIMFGDASSDQLNQIADLTHARVFDGRKNLIAAFKSVRGYN